MSNENNFVSSSCCLVIETTYKLRKALQDKKKSEKNYRKARNECLLFIQKSMEMENTNCLILTIVFDFSDIMLKATVNSFELFTYQ